MLPLELHDVSADSRYAGSDFRAAVRLVAEHLLNQTRPDLAAAAELADTLRRDALGLPKRWTGETADSDAEPDSETDSDSDSDSEPDLYDPSGPWTRPVVVGPASGRGPTTSIAANVSGTAAHIPARPVQESSDDADSDAESTSGSKSISSSEEEAASGEESSSGSDAQSDSDSDSEPGGGPAAAPTSGPRRAAPPAAGRRPVWPTNAPPPGSGREPATGPRRAPVTVPVAATGTAAPDHRALLTPAFEGSEVPAGAVSLLKRLDTLRSADRELSSGDLDLDVLTRRVLLLRPDEQVTPAAQRQLLQLVRDPLARDAKSLAELSAVRLYREGAFEPQFLRTDSRSRPRGWDWTAGGRSKDADLSQTAVQVLGARGQATLQGVTLSPWGSDAYVLAADNASELTGEPAALRIRGRAVPPEVFLALQGLDPMRDGEDVPKHLPYLLAMSEGAAHDLDLTDGLAAAQQREVHATNGLFAWEPLPGLAGRRAPVLRAPEGVGTYPSWLMRDPETAAAARSRSAAAGRSTWTGRGPPSRSPTRGRPRERLRLPARRSRAGPRLAAHRGLQPARRGVLVPRPAPRPGHASDPAEAAVPQCRVLPAVLRDHARQAGRHLLGHPRGRVRAGRRGGVGTPDRLHGPAGRVAAAHAARADELLRLPGQRAGPWTHAGVPVGPGRAAGQVRRAGAQDRGAALRHRHRDDRLRGREQDGGRAETQDHVAGQHERTPCPSSTRTSGATTWAGTSPRRSRTAARWTTTRARRTCTTAPARPPRRSGSRPCGWCTRCVWSSAPSWRAAPTTPSRGIPNSGGCSAGWARWSGCGWPTRRWTAPAPAASPGSCWSPSQRNTGLSSAGTTKRPRPPPALATRTSGCCGTRRTGGKTAGVSRSLPGWSCRSWTKPRRGCTAARGRRRRRGSATRAGSRPRRGAGRGGLARRAVGAALHPTPPRQVSRPRGLRRRGAAPVGSGCDAVRASRRHSAPCRGRRARRAGLRRAGLLRPGAARSAVPAHSADR
ncbi:hypothetical protein IHE61_27155 [Streptomyces sp. GKU 257-1]|nr:hypothetical protein [Streptomyces sp. GKU 257-1]